MKIIVTGGLGHIGSALIRKLPMVFPRAEIIVIDDLRTQRYCSLFDLPKLTKYQFLEIDLLEETNAERLKRVFNVVDAVVHLAAITDAASSFDNKSEVENVNYNATKCVAELCVAYDLPMIHLSSTSVYGTQESVVDENCSEKDLQPQSPYAETKLREEKLLKRMAVHNGLRFTTFRFGTICGVSPGMRFHTAVNKFCWQALTKQPITVWETALHQKRPYLNLRDATNAIVFFLKLKKFDGEVYNVVTENHTVNDIVEMIKVYATDIEITLQKTEIMNQLSYIVDASKIKALGFEIECSVEDSIKETMNFVL